VNYTDPDERAHIGRLYGASGRPAKRKRPFDAVVLSRRGAFSFSQFTSICTGKIGAADTPGSRRLKALGRIHSRLAADIDRARSGKNRPFVAARSRGDNRSKNETRTAGDNIAARFSALPFTSEFTRRARGTDRLAALASDCSREARSEPAGAVDSSLARRELASETLAGRDPRRNDGLTPRQMRGRAINDRAIPILINAKHRHFPDGDEWRSLRRVAGNNFLCRMLRGYVSDEYAEGYREGGKWRKQGGR